MNDKQYQKQRKRVLKYFHKWKRMMGIGWYEVDMEWIRERRSEKDEIAKEYTAAEVKSKWQYRSALISWYLPEIEPLSDDKVERIVVHELCHIIVGPLGDNAPDNLYDERELATQNLAIAYIWTYEAGIEAGKREAKKSKSKPKKGKGKK